MVFPSQRLGLISPLAGVGILHSQRGSKGGLAPSDANPAFGPLETKLVAWISDWGLRQVVGGLDKKSVAWISDSGAWTRNLGLGLGFLGLGQVIWGLD